MKCSAWGIVAAAICEQISVLGIGGFLVILGFRVPTLREISPIKERDRNQQRCTAVKFHGSARSDCYATPIIRLAALQHRQPVAFIIEQTLGFDKPRRFIAVSALLVTRRFALRFGPRCGKKSLSLCRMLVIHRKFSIAEARMEPSRNVRSVR